MTKRIPDGGRRLIPRLPRASWATRVGAWMVALAVVLPARAEISTESLLSDLLDLDRLTRLPDPPYTTRQFSSYNRASTTPADPEGWFANRDRGHFLRIEEVAGGREHVMMDAAGPGVIVRIWSASRRGMLRVYIDGGETPVIEAPVTDLLGGVYPGMPEPLAGVRARGYNLYFPIPYARHCRVTTDNEALFYHINYRTYPDGTPVWSFQPEDLARASDRIADVARRLRTPRCAIEPPPERREVAFEVEVAPGARARLLDADDGPGAIHALAVTIRNAGEDIDDALRGCVLEMRFDDHHTVESPLGDFFGTAPGLNAYESLPMGITDDPVPELWSHWRMPFARAARIDVRNLGRGAVTVSGRAAIVPWGVDERTLYFHAGWRIERDIPTRPFSDWTHLDCTGTGRFVGGALHIMNPVRRWWGEGDEKIYVDGERFPSHFGTGSEDYYGYAWCSTERFVHAYHNQPRADGPRNYGHVSNNRFHVIDDIPFTRSFRFDMENWHHNPITHTTRAAVSYWYARPGSTASFEPIRSEHVAPVRVPPFEMPRVAGAVEGESLRVLTPDVEAGPAPADERFSDGRQLVWNEARVGERIELGLDVEAGEDRRVWARLTMSRHAPRVRLHINGRQAGPVVDLSHHRTTPTESEIDLGRHRLQSGENRLAVEVVGPGANAPESDAFSVGLDYLRLE